MQNQTNDSTDSLELTCIKKSSCGAPNRGKTYKCRSTRQKSTDIKKRKSPSKVCCKCQMKPSPCCCGQTEVVCRCKKCSEEPKPSESEPSCKRCPCCCACCCEEREPKPKPKPEPNPGSKKIKMCCSPSKGAKRKSIFPNDSFELLVRETSQDFKKYLCKLKCKKNNRKIYKVACCNGPESSESEEDENSEEEDEFDCESSMSM